jgi:pSer/pThr/pTyr-binding forkhead associated (FHA) protein
MSRVLSVRVSFKGKELSSRTFESTSILIGRDADCDIRLDNVGVSRHHACVDQQGPGYLLRDLGSSNGTLVGDKRVSAWPINDGDHVRIAKFDLEFRISPESTTARGSSGSQAPALAERDTMMAADSATQSASTASERTARNDGHGYWRHPMFWVLLAASCLLTAGIVLLR